MRNLMILMVSALFILFTNVPVYSQDVEDPVAELLSQAQDSQRNDPRMSLGFAQRALVMATELNRDKQRCQALMTMGIANYYLGEYRLALRNYQDSLALGQMIGDASNSARALSNIGVIYFIWGEHDKALDYYNQALALHQEMDDKAGSAPIINNVANVHHTAGNFEQALIYYKKSMALYQELEMTGMVASSHNNIGLLLYDHGDYSDALEHLETALALGETIHEKPGMALSLTNIGLVLEKQGQLAEALDQHQRSLEIRRELEDRQGVSVCLHNIGKIYTRQGSFDRAIEHLNQALAMSEEMEIQELMRDNLLGLAEAYELAGDPAQALDYYRRYQAAHDKLFNEEQTQQMAAADARFQVELKDQEIEVLTKEKEIEKSQRNFLMMAVGLTLAILILIFNRYLFQKRAHQQISLANEAISRAHSDLEKASREELAHVGRVATMGELAAAFAHELNQPLGAIVVNTRAANNFLDLNSPDLMETKATLGDIRSDADRAQQIILRLRRMMRKEEWQSETLDANQVVREAAAFLKSEFKAQDVKMNLDLAEDLPAISGDRIQLQQVFLNVIQNAFAVAQGTTDAAVVISTKRLNRNTLCLDVHDSGPKVSVEVLSDMFVPFVTPKDEGLGMGLPICRTIVEAHGGEITAKQNPDRGLTVRVALPVLATEN